MNKCNQLVSQLKSIVNKNTQFENHFKLLNQGNFRSVYSSKDDLGNNIVFKVTHPCWNGEWVGNHRELETFNEINSMFPFLLPYILHPLHHFTLKNILFIAYPKVTTRFPPVKDRSEQFNSNLQTILSVFYDTTSNNLGVFNNLPVLIDYDQGYSMHEADLLAMA